MSDAIAIDLARIAREVGLGQESVSATLELLDEGNTVPFITRYRRDQTGGLNEEQIEQVRHAATVQRQLTERKQTILRSIESQHKLTDELRQLIERADSPKRLEDLYLPYRPKKESLASKARDRGLGPLAEEILTEADACRDLDARAADFVNPDKEVPDAASALLGAGHILAEQFNERADLRQKVRKIYRNAGRLVSKQIEADAKKNAQFHDFLDYQEKLGRVPPHRVLAINRGEKAKVLRVRVDCEEAAIEKVAIELLVKPDHEHREFVAGCVRDTIARLLLPSLEREVRRELTEKAEAHAVKVFARNLRNLLLQPPLRGRRVLAVDPGFKAGCKLAAIDENGQPLVHDHVHIVGSDAKKAAARARMVELVREHDLGVVAIGNGTACRQTEELIADILASELQDKQVEYVIVNEAGASVYSTSEIGREELPDVDPMQRSAISIGRRLQDPLSELVKIDPASIGVGLYQHDAKARHLRDSLDDVVQSCVSYVGVDVNSASPALLRYVSGMNQLTARRVYEHRQQHGPFRSRDKLREVSGLGEATFVQAAGFLKIVGGDNPLDATWIHPENYAAAERLLAKLDLEPAALGEKSAIERLVQETAGWDRDAISAELELGRFAVDDIISSLARPGRDPREDLPPPIFRRDVIKFDQLEEKMELRGTVLNVVDFGAFVDVGLSDSGLVHISQMSNDYIRDPHEVVSVGDQVRVWVATVDKDRRRVALTMIEPGTERPAEEKKSRRQRPPRRGARPADKSKQASATNGDDQSQKRGGRRFRDKGKRRDGKPPRREGAFEKRARKKLVPITKEMEEGKEAMRTFGDLLQYHKKKKQEDQGEQGDSPPT